MLGVSQEVTGQKYLPASQHPPWFLSLSVQWSLLSPGLLTVTSMGSLEVLKLNITIQDQKE